MCGNIAEPVQSVLCVPVVTLDGDCFAVIEFHRAVNTEPFGSDDLKIAIMVTGWMGAAIHQNKHRIALQQQQELNDYLLQLTRCYFSDTSIVKENMISEITVSTFKSNVVSKHLTLFSVSLNISTNFFVRLLKTVFT